jgi:hypothetical protein
VIKSKAKQDTDEVAETSTEQFACPMHPEVTGKGRCLHRMWDELRNS